VPQASEALKPALRAVVRWLTTAGAACPTSAQKPQASLRWDALLRPSLRRGHERSTGRAAGGAGGHTAAFKVAFREIVCLDAAAGEEELAGVATQSAYFELRPLSLGELLDRTFALYKRHFSLFATIMLLPMVIAFLASLPGVLAVAAPEAPAANPSLMGWRAGMPVLVLLGTVMLYFWVYAAAQGATVFAVSDLYLGRSSSVREAYARVRGKIGRIFLLILLIGAAMAAVMLLGMMVVMLPVAVALRGLSTTNPGALAVGVLALLAALIVGVIPAIVVWCRTALAIPVVVLENLRAGQAFGRSIRLSRGYAFRIFLVFVLVFILTLVAALILQSPFLLVEGSPLKPHALPMGMVVVSQLGSLLAGVLVGPVGTIAFALIYYDLRIRKEAFDLELLMSTLAPGSAAQAPSPA
jgi:hypothetical protein